jgi:hypothetical protein
VRLFEAGREKVVLGLGLGRGVAAGAVKAKKGVGKPMGLFKQAVEADSEEGDENGGVATR